MRCSGVAAPWSRGSAARDGKILNGERNGKESKTESQKSCGKENAQNRRKNIEKESQEGAVRETRKASGDQEVDAQGGAESHSQGAPADSLARAAGAQRRAGIRILGFVRIIATLRSRLPPSI